MERYNKILDKNPREIVLLKSRPCLYGKCSFCNYILDNSTDDNEITRVNDEVLSQITGELSVLEVINSGSVFELPQNILNKIKQIVEIKKIQVLYFEVYYAYRKRLNEIRDFFPNQEIRFRIGVETFDDDFRKEVLNKPFSTKNIEVFGKQFHACCLLICIQGQTKEQILNDINLAQKHFKEIAINVFINNTTPIKRDESLVKWFVTEIYPTLKFKPNIEILLDNKDFGVYVQ